MSKKAYASLGAFLLVLCAVVIIAMGRTYTVAFTVPAPVGSIEDYQVSIEQEGEVVRLVDSKLENDTLLLTIESCNQGKAYVDVAVAGDYIATDVLYVHQAGVITRNSYFGDCTGSFIVPIAVSVFLAVVLFGLVRRLRADVKRSLYQYRNVTTVGLIAFVANFLIMQTSCLISYAGPIETMRDILGSASLFTAVMFPIALVVFFLVAVSNIVLMRNEGVNWRNALGFLLGVLLCVGTLFPGFLSDMLQQSTLVDVHNEQGVALYVELGVENTIFVIVAYLECILIGTIFVSVKAAKRVPPFDRDYILILGCQIRKDGTLTKLLQGRADRALEFARMQKEATGKEIMFVPSGGQGPDEVMSEAKAISNYLVGQGIDEGRILVEGASANTFENFQNSVGLIQEIFGAQNPLIAFSTTNYHVFRSGLIAYDNGIAAEGIGSPTKSYFWVNAFIREFIATLYSQRNTHVKVLAIAVAAVLLMVLILYYANVM